MQLTSSQNILAGKNRNREGGIRLILFSLCFLAGCLLGSAFGSRSEWLSPAADGYLFSNPDEFGTVFSALWCIRFQLLAFLLGTSFLGTFFLPVLIVFRAFLLSCASYDIITEYTQNGVIMALIIICLPALISVTCFMVISSEAFSSSLSLMRLTCGDYRRARGNRCKYFLFCLPFMAVGIILEIRIVPYLVTLLAS